MANVFSNIGSGKKEEKKTKTKQSNLSSKITINKNTNSKSIQENLNKSSVTNPLSNSTQGSKVKVVNTKLSADTKASKTDKAKVSSNKATVTNPLETSYQPSTKNTQKVTSNNEAKSKKNVFNGYFSGENLANSNAEFGSSTSANIGKQVVNNIIEGQREAKQFIDTVGKLISIGSKARMNTVVTNDKGEQKSLAAPIQTGTQKVANVLDKADNWIDTEASKINQRHLDAKFSTYIDEDSVYEKIKNDDTYASKLVNSDGGLIDYSDQIAALEEKVKTSSKTDADVELLNELKEIKDDQNKIVYASFYKQLEENGATEEELNEFKNAVIIGDYNLVQRAVTNFGGTVEGYIGGTVKGYDTIFAKISELLGVDYEQAEYVDKVIDHAEDLQALTRQNASSGMEKFVYDVYDGMSSFLYATMTTTAAHYLKGGNPLNTLSKAEYDAIIGTPSLLLSDVSVLGTKMKENVEAGYDFDTSFNNAFWHAVKSHMTESIGGESLANIVTGEISEETLEHTMTYMIKSMSNQFLSEFAEEGMEAAVEPIIDAKTLNTGLTVEGYIKQVFNGDTAYQMLVGGMGGLVMGSIASTSNVISYNKQINEYVDSIKIETKKDYNVANDVISDLENIVADAQSRIRQKEANGEDVTLDKNQTIISNQIIKAYKKKVNDYASTHPYLNSYASEEDTSNIDLSDARETILDAAKPDMASAMDEIVEAKRVIEEQSQKAVDALQEKLNKDNVNISATEFVNMSDEAKEQVLLVNKYAQATNKNVSFANLVGKDGSIIDGLHDSSTGQIIINPNAKRGALSTLVHEFTHGVESSRYYGELEKLTREYYGDDISNKIQYIKDNYSSIQILSDQDAVKELVAITTQDLLGNQDYVDRLVMYNNSLAFRLYEDIKSLNESTGTVGDIETTFMRAFENCKSQINDQSFQFSKYVDADSVIKAAKEEFGTTSSYIKAGYILPDGDYLDLSEGQNRRTQDHREVGYLFDIDYAKEGMSAGMIQFMNLGNIRIHPESCGIDISNATNPTYEQYQTIRSYLKNFSGDEIYLDVSDENGRNVFSIAYKEGTSTNRVLEDIKQYFENGIIPENNHDDYFDYSKGISLTDKQNYSDATASNDIDKAQTIVDKLAKANGYNVEAWHGTNNYGFTVFKTDIENNESNIGSHFGTQKAAEGFAYDEYAHGNGERGVYHVYLKALNPYETYDMFAQENCYIAAETLSLANNLDTLEAQEIKQYIGDKYHLVNIDEDMDEAWRYGESEKAIGDDGVEKGLNYILDKKLYQYFADMVKANGYDSITYENTLEDDGNVDYVILDPQSIKSADAITYDNEGKVISLEERFNNQNEDIRYSNGVKLSDSKNDKGEFLTNDQEEYFKESKLRDAEGNLKVVYHGTNSNFDTFNRAYARSSGLYGNGFYFGYGENTSNLYGNSKPYYLNLTNPLYANGEKTFNISNEQKKAFIEAVANNEDYTLNNYGVDATVDSVYNLTKDHDDFAFINDLNLTCIGNMVEATELFNEVNGTNYDGIIVNDQVVAFYPNQIKSIENLHPTANNNYNLSKGVSLADIQTSDNDIRYDLGQEYDSNGRQLSEEQKKYFKYSKIRTPNGDMLVMYHGTNADFTEFDSSKIGTHGAFEGSGFNFTSSESRAKEYANGGNVMEGYLNITNPLSTTEKTINVEELANIIKRVDPMGDDIISGYATNTSDYGTQEFVDRESLNAAQTIFEHANSDADIYSDLSSVGGSVELMNAFKEMGYDGVIHYNVDGNIQTAVIFDSNQMKNINNLNPTINSDIRYSLSKEDIEKNNKWVERTQKVINDINQSENVELTIDDIDDILQQKQLNPRTVKMIERTKKKMRETANEWVKGYDTIRAEYPNFSEETFKNAIYEILIEDGMSEETYNAMANTLSAEFSLEGVDADVRQSIEDFIQESLKTFDNETRYQAGEYDKESLKKSIKINNAYESQTIDEIYQKAKKGSDLDRKSAQVKKDLQTYWQPVVDRLYQTDLTSRETKGKRADRKVSWWKTIDQNIFELANGSKEVYDMLKKKFRYELLDDAASTREKTLRNAQTNVIDKIKALGIVEGSKEDIALQYFLEGHTEKKRTDIDINSKEYLTQETIDEYKKNPYVKYTLEDLMKEFDYKMPNGKTAAENIVAAAEIMRNAYDQTYSDIIDSQIIANGDIEGKAEAEIAEKLAELNKAKLSMDNALAEIKKDGSKESTQAAFEILKKKYNKVLKEYNTLVEKNSSHDLTRRNLTPFRENYVHHIVKNNLFQDISSIFKAESNVPTELAGVSDYTSPNTAFSSFSMAQEGGRYTPTALGSYAAYMTEAADVLAYNPVILSIRQLNKDIKSTTKGNNLNRLSEYLNDYANILAGKRDNIDRGVQKIIGPRYMALIKKMNSYAKAAALTANIKSGLTQFANIPNGMAILESKGGKSYVTDMAKGIVDWVKAFNSEGKTAIDQSSFMTNRYFGFDTGKTGFGQSVKDATDWILTVGDKIGAETIWWSAYEQGNRLYSETGISPIQYADDVTRSAIASRTKEDMALTMQSQTINLLLPFQVENNNLYQTLKQFGASKHLGAIATYNVAAFIFNMIMKGLIGNDDEILPEVITPIYKETKKTIEDEQEINDTVENIFFGEIAEYISLLPWGSTAIQLMFGDDSETVFGDYNPNRYGTTNIGLSGIGNLITDMKNHSEDPAQQVLDIFGNILEGYVKGGKQIMRTTEGLQSMGGLPDYKGGEIQMSPVNYTTSGQNVAYVNNQNNILDWVRAALFGKWNTSEAQNYLGNDYDYLSKSEMNVFDTLQANNEGNDYQNYLTAKDYKNKEEKSSNKDNKDTVKASTEETETEEKSLREELLEQGKYGSYKDSVRDAYDDYLKSWYKEEHEEDDEPKSFTQFANGYGLTSDDLKQDTYGAFYDAYKISEDAQKTFSEALDIENSKNALNKTIANSGATQRRVIYEQLGIYDQILEFIENNGLEYSDFGLTKTVVGYDQSDINKMMAKINGESYDGGSSGGSSGSGKGSSSTASKQLKAMKAYMSALTSNNNIFSALDNMTTIDDAKKNVEDILKDAYKG